MPVKYTMFHLWISTIFICIFWSFGEAIPKIKYNGKEIDTSNEQLLFQSGSSLVLICEGIHPVTWKLPYLNYSHQYEHNTQERANTENSNLKRTGSGYSYETKLTVDNLHYLDTGNFICHHKKGTDIDDPRVATKVYIYVEDKSHLFVKLSGMETVHFPEKNRAVIPCRTTHPNITVRLENLGTQLYPSNESRWSFDPREGFIREEMKQEESSLFECLAKNEAGVQEKLTIDVTVDAAGNVPISKPVIDDRNATRVSVKDKFQLNCSVSFKTTSPVQLQWIIPNTKGIMENGRIQEGKFVYSSLRLTTNATGYRLLTVNKAEYDDEGFYICQAIDHRNRTESTQVGIRIPDYRTSQEKGKNPKNSASCLSKLFQLQSLPLIIFASRFVLFPVLL